MPRIAALITLVSIALLGFAGPAQAAVLESPLPLVTVFDETEEEAEASEEELETCDEEAEECEEGEAASGPEERRSDAPGKCLLRSTSARAVTKNDKLKLTIGYTTNEPSEATVEIKRGAVRIGSLHRHLGRSGVLRFSKELNEEQSGKLVVRILLPKRKRAGCPSRRLVLFPK